LIDEVVRAVTIDPKSLRPPSKVTFGHKVEYFALSSSHGSARGSVAVGTCLQRDGQYFHCRMARRPAPSYDNVQDPEQMAVNLDCCRGLHRIRSLALNNFEKFELTKFVVWSEIPG
jgi:hypothetical protein